MSILEKLLLGIAGPELIDEAERRHDQRVKEREQQRLDSLFWQDAARRGDPAYEEEDEDVW